MAFARPAPALQDGGQRTCRTRFTLQCDQRMKSLSIKISFLSTTREGSENSEKNPRSNYKMSFLPKCKLCFLVSGRSPAVFDAENRAIVLPATVWQEILLPKLLCQPFSLPTVQSAV